MKKTFIVLMALCGVAAAESVGYTSMTAAQKESVVFAWDLAGVKQETDSPVAVGTLTGSFTLNTTGTAASLYASDTEVSNQPKITGLASSFSDGNFTISFDIHSFTANNWQTLVGLYSSAATDSGNEQCVQIGVNTSGKICIFNKVGGPETVGYAGINTSGDLTTSLSSGMSNTSTLTLVSDMTKNKTLSVYVDGGFVAAYSNCAATSNQALDAIYFGCDSTGNRDFPSAEISNITIWNKALTKDEVSALTVPEPTTATLTLLALAGLAARRRRK